MDVQILAFIVIVGVAVACWTVVQFWSRRPRGGYYDLLDYAAYAVKAARAVTGSADNVELGNKAADYLKAKFPKAPDVDVEVAIAAALNELEKPTPPPAQTVPSGDLF